MKKLLTLLATLVLTCALCCGIALADDSATVIVTIADQNGNLVLASEKIEVKDIDNAGELTVNDALYCAHEAKFSGGAAAGYLSEMGDYGLSLKKLWGFDNGTGYGYYVDNGAAMSLADKVKDGDTVNAFIYTDTTAWSDTYCYFNACEIETPAGTNIPFELTAVGFDESYNTVLKPVEGATILVDGKAVDAKTDKDGKVTILFDTEGTFILSAKSDSQTLVPPCCRVIVKKAEKASDGKDDKDGKADGGSKEDTPKTADTMMVALFAVIAVASLGVVAASKKASRA